MRTIFLLLALTTSVLYGKGYTVTASGGAPVPTSFSTSDSQSKIGECQGNVIEFINSTDAPLSFGFGSSTAVPVQGDYAYVPAGPGGIGRFKPKGGVGPYLYIRAAGGATATSASIYVSCYFEEKP